MSPEIISSETMQRLDEVEQQVKNMQGQLMLCNAEAFKDQKKLMVLEETAKRHDDDLRQLKESTSVMKIQFEQVVSKIDMLEIKLFNWLQQSVNDSSKERQTSQKAWMDFVKYVLGGTVIAIVTYVFTRGG